MSYAPGVIAPYDDNIIHPGTLQSVGLELLNMNLTTFASTAWPTANLAIYVPFVIHRPRTIVQVGWMNGATTVTGTKEVGVYNTAGTKLISGSAAGSGVSTLQKVDVTDTTLQPGQYWLAITDSATTGFWYAIAPTAPLCAALGILSQATANPLPSTATMAKDQTLAFVPLGFLQFRSIL